MKNGVNTVSAQPKSSNRNGPPGEWCCRKSSSFSYCLSMFAWHASRLAGSWFITQP